MSSSMGSVGPLPELSKFASDGDDDDGDTTKIIGIHGGPVEFDIQLISEPFIWNYDDNNWSDDWSDDLPQPAEPVPEVVTPPQPAEPVPEVVTPPQPTEPVPEVVTPPQPTEPVPKVVTPPQPAEPIPKIVTSPQPTEPVHEVASSPPQTQMVAVKSNKTTSKRKIRSSDREVRRRIPTVTTAAKRSSVRTAAKTKVAKIIKTKASVKAAFKAAAEKAAAEKAVAEKVATEKAAIEKAAIEKAADEAIIEGIVIEARKRAANLRAANLQAANKQAAINEAAAVAAAAKAAAKYLATVPPEQEVSTRSDSDSDSEDATTHLRPKVAPGCCAARFANPLTGVMEWHVLEKVEATGTRKRMLKWAVKYFDLVEGMNPTLFRKHVPKGRHLLALVRDTDKKLHICSTMDVMSLTPSSVRIPTIEQFLVDDTPLSDVAHDHQARCFQTLTPAQFADNMSELESFFLNPEVAGSVPWTLLSASLLRQQVLAPTTDWPLQQIQGSRTSLFWSQAASQASDTDIVVVLMARNARGTFRLRVCVPTELAPTEYLDLVVRFGHPESLASYVSESLKFAAVVVFERNMAHKQEVLQRDTAAHIEDMSVNDFDQWKLVRRRRIGTKVLFAATHISPQNPAVPRDQWDGQNFVYYKVVRFRTLDDGSSVWERAWMCANKLAIDVRFDFIGCQCTPVADIASLL